MNAAMPTCQYRDGKRHDALKHDAALKWLGLLRVGVEKGWMLRCRGRRAGTAHERNAFVWDLYRLKEGTVMSYRDSIYTSQSVSLQVLLC